MMRELVLTPVVWSRFPDVDEVQPLSERDAALFSELRDVLKKYGALDRFGVSLIHRHFGLSDGEVIFETTNSDNRTQSVEVRSATEVLTDKRVLATQWVFDGSGENVVCEGYCSYEDYAHKSRHRSK